MDPNREYTGREAWFLCDRHDAAPVVNEDGVALQAFQSDCALLGSAWQSYVFLLLPGQSRSDANLILSAQGSMPSLAWSGKTAVIGLPADIEVEKKVVRLYGIGIVYGSDDAHPRP